MTTAEARLLQELIRNESFEAIVAELVATEISPAVRVILTHARTGDAVSGAFAAGRVDAFESLLSAFKRLAERYRASAPDRS